MIYACYRPGTLDTRGMVETAIYIIYLSESTEPAAAGVRLPDHHTLHTPSPNQKGMMELWGSL